MNDLERYLKTEYRDPDFQLQELRHEDRRQPVGWSTGLLSLVGLCLLLVNLLYWSP